MPTKLHRATCPHCPQARTWKWAGRGLFRYACGEGRLSWVGD